MEAMRQHQTRRPRENNVPPEADNRVIIGSTVIVDNT